SDRSHGDRVDGTRGGARRGRRPGPSTRAAGVGQGLSPYEHPHLDFDLSDEHRLIQRTVRDFAEQEVAPVAEELDRTKSFPYDVVRQLGELGLMGIPFPEDYGGGGGDSLAYALAVEELTRVDSSVAITMTAHTSLGTQPIYLFGSDEQKREWLPELCAGRRPGAGRTGRIAGLRPRAPRLRPADREIPGDPGQAGRHGDRDRGRPAAGLQSRPAQGRRSELQPHRRPGQAQDRAAGRPLQR